MAYGQVGVGTVANDNTGDPIRTAFQTINANFTTLDSLFADTATLTITSNNLTGTAVDTNIIITPNGTGHVVIADDRVNVSTALTPASSKGVAGDTIGDIAWDSNYVYVCQATYTTGTPDIWSRAALTLATW